MYYQDLLVNIEKCQKYIHVFGRLNMQIPQIRCGQWHSAHYKYLMINFEYIIISIHILQNIRNLYQVPRDGGKTGWGGGCGVFMCQLRQGVPDKPIDIETSQVVEVHSQEVHGYPYFRKSVSLVLMTLWHQQSDVSDANIVIVYPQIVRTRTVRIKWMLSDALMHK